MQTGSRVGSGSAEGLQGAGVGDRFLAQERVMQLVSTGLAPGVRRVLRFEDSGSACSRPRPPTTPGPGFSPAHPCPVLPSVQSAQGLSSRRALESDSPQASTCSGQGRVASRRSGSGGILVPCCPFPKRGDKECASRMEHPEEGLAGMAGAALSAPVLCRDGACGQGQDAADTRASRKIRRFIKTYSAQTHGSGRNQFPPRH